MSPRDRLARASRASASLGTLVLAVLMPKCPLCVAAVLSAIGLGATWSSSLAPVVRPVGFAMAGLALFVLLRGEWRRRRLRAAGA